MSYNAPYAAGGQAGMYGGAPAPYGGAAAGGGAGGARAGGCVLVGPNEDCTACGVGCGGNGNGLSYVGYGQGSYIQETTYKYVGCGGDFDRPKRDFTCLITTCCLLSLLCCIPLLCWLFSGTTTTMYNCEEGLVSLWSSAKQEFCCASVGVGCPTTEEPDQGGGEIDLPTLPPITQPATPPPTLPPTPPPTQAPS